MAKFIKTEIAKTLDIATGTIPAEIGDNFEKQARGEKTAENATEKLVQAFITNNWDFTYTISPMKTGGLVVNPDSKSSLTPAQYAELALRRARGRGQSKILKVNPEYIADMVKLATKAVKLATTAVANAKGKSAKVKKVVAASLTEAEDNLLHWQGQRDERRAVAEDAKNGLKSLRRSLARTLFNEHRVYLLNDGKSPEQADIGAAMLVDAKQKEAGLSFKYGGDKHLPANDAKPEKADVLKARESIVKAAISKLEKLPQNEVENDIKALKALLEPNH